MEKLRLQHLSWCWWGCCCSPLPPSLISCDEMFTDKGGKISFPFVVRLLKNQVWSLYWKQNLATYLSPTSQRKACCGFLSVPLPNQLPLVGWNWIILTKFISFSLSLLNELGLRVGLSGFRISAGAREVSFFHTVPTGTGPTKPPIQQAPEILGVSRPSLEATTPLHINAFMPCIRTILPFTVCLHALATNSCITLNHFLLQNLARPFPLTQ
jgi:hypothetical protein